ncbi:hypothetical protein [Priestia megaterium]|uniref:hypothetical protein n=1 Tax=Priestia megaterium TaxID=1404 RepID=UPI001155E39B|nr:hypothetical protein [Priestia megaterium]
MSDERTNWINDLVCSLVTALLISVQDFAFRRSLRLALQSTARSRTYMNVHYTNKNPNKFDSQSRIKLVRIFL